MDVDHLPFRNFVRYADRFVHCTTKIKSTLLVAAEEDSWHLYATIPLLHEQKSQYHTFDQSEGTWCGRTSEGKYNIFDDVKAISMCCSQLNIRTRAPPDAGSSLDTEHILGVGMA